MADIKSQSEKVLAPSILFYTDSLFYTDIRGGVGEEGSKLVAIEGVYKSSLIGSRMLLYS